MPPYFQENIEPEKSIQSYGNENLSDLDCKMMTEYIHSTVIPELTKKEVPSEVEFLKRYNLTEICDSTVLKLMHVLVFLYGIYKKNYYVGSHKSPGTVCNRWKFIDQYLAMERRIHKWIQMEKL